MIPLPPIPPILIKLAGGLLACLALFLLVHDRNQWKTKASDRQATINLICKATGAAASNPKLECGHVVEQINAMGLALKATTDALNDQNAKVLAMKAESDRQQIAAANAVKQAAGRADRANATATRLDASSRASERLTKPCAPSDELQGAWK